MGHSVAESESELLRAEYESWKLIVDSWIFSEYQIYFLKHETIMCPRRLKNCPT